MELTSLLQLSEGVGSPLDGSSIQTLLILLVFEIFHHSSGLVLLAVLGRYRRTAITAVLLRMSDLVLSRNLTLGGTSKITTITFFRFEFTSYDLMTSLLSVAIKDEP